MLVAFLCARGADLGTGTNALSCALPAHHEAGGLSANKRTIDGQSNARSQGLWAPLLRARQRKSIARQGARVASVNTIPELAFIHYETGPSCQSMHGALHASHGAAGLSASLAGIGTLLHQVRVVALRVGCRSTVANVGTGFTDVCTQRTGLEMHR
jgi:hypothetical protein